MGLIQTTNSADIMPRVELLWAAVNDTVQWDEADRQRVESWLRVRLGNASAEVAHFSAEERPT
jgi:hypothetical protein